MNAASWINEKMNEWLGEKNAADTIAQSVPNNITSEMGLALLDVADVIRPYPEVIEYLQRSSLSQERDDNFLDELVRFDGGQKTGTRSTLISTNMECDVPEKSILQKPAGAKTGCAYSHDPQ